MFLGYGHYFYIFSHTQYACQQRQKYGQWKKMYIQKGEKENPLNLSYHPKATFFWLLKEVESRK